MNRIAFWLCFLSGLGAAGIVVGEEPAEHPLPPLIRTKQSGAWSAPETWEGNHVPGAGARVQIGEGDLVTFDVSSEQVIRSIHVAGILTFARDRDTRLDVGLIKIQPGEDASEDGFNCEAHMASLEPGRPRPALEVGTPEEPIPAKYTATIRLAAIDGMDKESCPAIVCCGGRMDLHGAPLNRTWVKLGATVNPSLSDKEGAETDAGDSEVRLAEAVTGWRIGDHIIVTTTGSRERINTRITLRPGGPTEPAPSRGTSRRDKDLESFPGFTEERTIVAIHGDRLILDHPLSFKHRGEGDYRGEVANLSRNVVIESADPAKSRGHTMYHRYSTGSVSYAEFRHLGKEGVLGKYPLHIHLAADTMRGSYILGASVWDSGNRWITVHGTDYFVVRDCVGYQSLGHGFYMEDATEVFNVFDRNLAVQAFETKKLPDQVLPFDHNDGAGFWWANSRNTLTRNVAVECDGWGFRFEAVPTRILDLNRPVLQPDGSIARVDVRTLPFVRFDGNEAHDQGTGIELGNGDGQVGPDAGHPFVLRNTRIWNTQWAFVPRTRCAVENLDIADSIYGFFEPAYDVELPWQRGTRVSFLRTGIPLRLPPGPRRDVDDPADRRDLLPPTTIITSVRKKPGGQLVVEGTTSDDHTVQKVLVNGKEAHATEANFAQWEITLIDLPPGSETKLSAYAVDDSGNVEPKAQIVLIDSR